ncbi:hypothetical protein Tco_1019435 [Tanacetum coccineum]|uniref:Integrase, catalytic region, zinc finger, CCHC-type, peptidase aspartic, catalytic n=1 Tax=Tanacetum coccineum TaxID=301880 RepID=A0ABQ5FX75_9ASTR
MSSNSDDIQAAGSDTRPHMLDRTDYESWSQRIRLPRTYEDLSDTEKKRYDADVRATNIVLQGLPKDIYKLINHNIEAKAIWDNFHQYPSSSTNPQSPQYHIPDTAQINSDTLQTDEILDINQKMGAPGPYTFRATLPQTNNQLQTSSNTRNQATIQDGPFELGTTRDALGTTPKGGVLLGLERPRTYEDLSDTKKKRYDADVRATNIVLQGLPKDIYKLINHNIEAKAIWDNVKMLLAGSELTKEDR